MAWSKLLTDSNWRIHHNLSLWKEVMHRKVTKVWLSHFLIESPAWCWWNMGYADDACLMVKSIRLASYCLNMLLSQNTIQHKPLKTQYNKLFSKQNTTHSSQNTIQYALLKAQYNTHLKEHKTPHKAQIMIKTIYNSLFSKHNITHS